MSGIRMLAGAVFSGLLAGAAWAQDGVQNGANHAATPTGNANIDQKAIYRPDPRMMLRAPGAASLTPGADKRGLQTVDPAGPAVGAGTGPRDPDTPAAAAVRSDAAQLTPSSAAQAIGTAAR